jgi:beta-N-acetylhexosaminidase
MFWLFICVTLLFRTSYALESDIIQKKIGQLFIVPACPMRGDDHFADLKRAIEEFHVGGFILKQGDPHAQIALIQKIQKISTYPLLFIMDAEWGLSMRLSDTVIFPKNLTLGAIQNQGLLYRLGKEIGLQCKAVGAQMNLAPVVDVNCNALNPIIHMRSFGDSPQHVAECATSLMKGMQSAGILTCAKHFPGHGDTTIDSHVELPLVPHSLKRIKQVELFPFVRMIDEGVDAIMSAHLYVPILDPVFPVTLSYPAVHLFLQIELQFKGLIISDALNMKGLASHYSTEDIAIKTFKAGHDLLLYGDHIAPNINQILRTDLPQAFHALEAAFHDKTLSEEELDGRVKKIQKAIEKCGPPTFNLDFLNRKEALDLKRELYREAITLIKNENHLPLKIESPIQLILSGDLPFFEAAIMSSFCIDDDSQVAIIAASKITSAIKEKIQELNDEGKKVIFVCFTSPYHLIGLPSASTLICAYEAEEEAQIAAADVISGKLEAKGQLPIFLKN